MNILKRTVNLNTQSIRSIQLNALSKYPLTPLGTFIYRQYSAASQRDKANRMGDSFRNSMLQIFDPYIPPAKLPLPFSAEGRTVWKTIAQKWGTSMWCYIQLWKDKISVSRKEIPYTAERLYATMNEAIAENDFSKLKKCTTPSMFFLLSEKLMVRAASKKHGRLVWKDEGAVSKTKVVHSVVGEVPIDLRNTVKRMQVTVTIHRRQSLQAAGKEPIVKDIQEYLILEKDVEDPNADWLIAGKLKESSS